MQTQAAFAFIFASSAALALKLCRRKSKNAQRKEKKSKHIILFKDFSPAYEEAFCLKGIKVKFERILDFKRTNSKCLRFALQKPNNYSGIILTSPRAASCLVDATNKNSKQSVDDRFCDDWKSKKIYLVGEVSWSMLSKNGFLSLHGGSNAPKSADLCKIIEDTQSGSIAFPLLYLCGNTRRNTVSQHLKDKGIGFRELVVYESARTCRKIDIQFCGVTYLVFFSPLGVKIIGKSGLRIERLLNGHDVSNSKVVFAAIGPTTAKAIHDRWGNNVHVIVPKSPNPSGLAHAIYSHLHAS